MSALQKPTPCLPCRLALYKTDHPSPLLSLMQNYTFIIRCCWDFFGKAHIGWVTEVAWEVILEEGKGVGEGEEEREEREKKERERQRPYLFRGALGKKEQKWAELMSWEFVPLYRDRVLPAIHAGWCTWPGLQGAGLRCACILTYTISDKIWIPVLERGTLLCVSIGSLLQPSNKIYSFWRCVTTQW